MNPKTPPTVTTAKATGVEKSTPVATAHDAEIEAGLFADEVQENRPFITLKFIPGTTPNNRFIERCTAFVQWLDRDQLEILGALCIIERGEKSTPEELGEAASMAGTLGQEA